MLTTVLRDPVRRSRLFWALPAFVMSLFAIWEKLRLGTEPWDPWIEAALVSWLSIAVIRGLILSPRGKAIRALLATIGSVMACLGAYAHPPRALVGWAGIALVAGVLIEAFFTALSQASRRARESTASPSSR